MATTDDITVLEYGRIEDAIEERVRMRDETVRTGAIAIEAAVGIEKVRESLLHMQRKHGRVTDMGVGEWELELPE